MTVDTDLLTSVIHERLFSLRDGGRKAHRFATELAGRVADGEPVDTVVEYAMTYERPKLANPTGSAQFSDTTRSKLRHALDPKGSQ